jgi:hypothetical protein
VKLAERLAAFRAPAFAFRLPAEVVPATAADIVQTQFTKNPQAVAAMAASQQPEHVRHHAHGENHLEQRLPWK